MSKIERIRLPHPHRSPRGVVSGQVSPLAIRHATPQAMQVLHECETVCCEASHRPLQVRHEMHKVSPRRRHRPPKYWALKFGLVHRILQYTKSLTRSARAWVWHSERSQVHTKVRPHRSANQLIASARPSRHSSKDKKGRNKMVDGSSHGEGKKYSEPAMLMPT